MKKSKAILDSKNGIAAIVEEKNGYSYVIYIDKNGKKLIEAIIIGSTVTYKLG